MTTLQNQFYMAGTEGTGEYKVVAVSDLGRVGYRELPGSRVRVRVELNPDTQLSLFQEAFPENEWKHPDFWQHRFSTVIDSAEADEVIAYARGVLENVCEQVGKTVVYRPTPRFSVLRSQPHRFVVVAGVIIAGVIIFELLRRQV